MIRRRRRHTDPRDLRATPEEVALNRRAFLRRMGITTLGMLGASLALPACASTSKGTGAEAGSREFVPGCGAPDPAVMDAPFDPLALPPAPTGAAFPYPRNDAFALDRPLTDRATASSVVNFYEFSGHKEEGARLASRNLRVAPWRVEVGGLCHRPRTFDLDDLMQLPLEERLYRMRCVEAWSMAVPWTGAPLRHLLEAVQPMTGARWVRFISFDRPAEARQQRIGGEPFPYYESLRIDEAMHELTLLAVGMYGRQLPRQNGAPVRVVVPWKYGFKSAKSVVRIELVEEEPCTFWNDLMPAEYDRVANVNPAVTNGRYRQHRERIIDTGEWRETLLFNGYGDQVANLYA